METVTDLAFYRIAEIRQGDRLLPTGEGRPTIVLHTPEGPRGPDEVADWRWEPAS